MSAPAREILYTAEDIYSLAFRGKDIPREFVNVQDNDQFGQTALHLAVIRGYAHIVRALLTAGANPNSVDYAQNTALHLLASRPGPESVEIIQALLDAGADPKATNEHRNTGLHFAAWHGNIPVIQVLLNRGIDPNARNTLGQTTLHCAAKHGEIGAIELLLAAGADPNAIDDEGKTPLYYTVWHERVAAIQFLLETGAGLWEGHALPALREAGKKRDTPVEIFVELNRLEHSMLTEPFNWPHLNFNGFPQARIAEIEKCLVTLATHYEFGHPKKAKALTSLSLNGLPLTSTLVDALIRIIHTGTLSSLSLAGVSFVNPQDGAKLAEAIDAQLLHMTQYVMSDSSTCTLLPSLASLVKTSITRTFLAPPKTTSVNAKVTTSLNAPASLSAQTTVQPIPRDMMGVSASTYHQGNTSPRLRWFIERPQTASRDNETQPLIPTEQPAAPGCFKRLFDSCCRRG